MTFFRQGVQGIGGIHLIPFNLQVLERGVPGGAPAQPPAGVQQHVCLGVEPVQEPHFSLLVRAAIMAMVLWWY